MRVKALRILTVVYVWLNEPCTFESIRVLESFLFLYTLQTANSVLAGLGGRGKRPYFLDPELSQEGRVQVSAKGSQAIAARSSKKCVVDFSAPSPAGSFEEEGDSARVIECAQPLQALMPAVEVSPLTGSSHYWQTQAVTGFHEHSTSTLCEASAASSLVCLSEQKTKAPSLKRKVELSMSQPEQEPAPKKQQARNSL